MPDIEQPIKDQDFMPVKKPNLWQKLLLWLAALTPKNKLLVSGLIILSIIGVVYFSFAALLPNDPNDPGYGGGAPGGGTTIPPYTAAPLPEYVEKAAAASEDPSLFLTSPTSPKNEIAEGEFLQVEVWLKTEKAEGDIVAVAGRIEYDPTLLSLQSIIDTDEFPQSGAEQQDVVIGNYDLIRGTYGNGNPKDGSLGPSLDYKGANGILPVVTFTFKTLKVINNADTPGTIYLKNVLGVKDNGAGDTVTMPDKSLSYTIKPYTAPTAKLLINNLKINPIKNGSTWDVEITWDTNKESTTELELPVGSASLSKPALTTKHVILVTGQAAGTYTYKAISKATGSTDVDDDTGEFTLGSAKTNLLIKNLSAKASYESAIISWNTEGGANNGEANGRIDSCSPSIAGSYSETTQTLSHFFQISGLTGATTYKCTVSSSDGSETVSGEVTFTTKNGVGFDANVVLRVEPDRICDAWLYCRSSLQVKNTNGETENLCFDLGVCDEKDAQGNCVSSPYAIALSKSGEQTYKHPITVNSIDNLSGLAKVGLAWFDQDGNPKLDENSDPQIINGYYNYAAMKTKGLDIYIPNSDFESGSVWPWKASNKQNTTLIVDNRRDSNALIIRPQKVTDGSAWSGAEISLGNIAKKVNYVYAISMGIWTSGQARDVYVRLKVANEDYDIVSKVSVTNYPQTIVLMSNQINSDFDPKDNITGSGLLAVSAYDDPANPDNRFEDEFYIDNVSIKSVLEVSSFKNVARSCRLYPSGDAVTCDYDNSSGQQMRGWKGFCVEEDPKYLNDDPTQRMCLNWWPVDIINGETDIFGQTKIPEYLRNLRRPLYYCIEAAGNYPYVRNTRTGNSADQYSPALMYRYCPKTGGLTGALIGVALGGVPGSFIGFNYKSGDYRICGWGGENSGRASGRWTSLAPEEKNLRLEDIERIVLTALCEEGDGDEHCFSKKDKGEKYIVLDRTTDWQGFRCNGANCHDAAYYFQESNNIWTTTGQPSMINDHDLCAKQGVDFFAVRAVFDNNGFFTGLQSGLCNGQGDGGDEGYVRYKTTFYLREVCNVIAEVVTPDGENTAWASRAVDNGWKQGNILGYKYKSDYEPYGAAVVGERVDDPSSWQNSLFVMPAITQDNYTEPYQVRAGMPYGVEDTLQKYCTSNIKRDVPCSTATPAGSAVCNYFELDPNAAILAMPTIIKGECGITEKSLKIGKAQCMSGEADKLGTQCTDSSDCGVSYDNTSGGTGVCMGVNLDSQASGESLYGGYKTGQNNLENLFARSYRIWRWTINGYEEFTENENPVYGWDLTKEDAQEANRPTISDLKINSQTNGDVLINKLQNVRLEFKTVINFDHLPLVAFRVDWGDGTPISQVNNLKMDPQSNSLILFHSYDCAGASCNYTPKVQIEDNWGWCNDGTASNKCPADSATWQAYGGAIKVQ